MNAQPILNRIEQDARQTAAAMLRDAQARADAVHRAAEEKIEAERERTLEQARRDALDMDDRMQRMARLDGRKALLAAKRQVLDEAFAGALDKLRAMPAPQARAFGLRLLLEAAHGDEQVVADEQSAWCDEAFIQEATDLLSKAGRPARLTLAAQSRALGGGFALLRGGMEINCSFPAVVASQRAEMEAEIAALLFD